MAKDSAPAGTAVTGHCSQWTIELGRCFNGVKDGKAQGVIVWISGSAICQSRIAQEVVRAYFAQVGGITDSLISNPVVL